MSISLNFANLKYPGNPGVEMCFEAHTNYKNWGHFKYSLSNWHLLIDLSTKWKTTYQFHIASNTDDQNFLCLSKGRISLIKQRNWPCFTRKYKVNVELTHLDILVNSILGFDFFINSKIKSTFKTNSSFLQKNFVICIGMFQLPKKVESVYIAWKKMKQDLTSLSTQVTSYALSKKPARKGI